MPTDNPRDPFVAAIEAKIAAWTAVLESYRAAASLDGGLGDVTPDSGNGIRLGRPVEPGRPVDLPVGVFRDKSLREAISIYLGAARRKLTNKELAIGLKAGGFATTSVNFEATLATALGRMKDDGVVLRFPDGWDLASSYPDSLRTRLNKDAKAKPIARRTRKPAKKKAAIVEVDKTSLIHSFILNSTEPMSVSDVVAKFDAEGGESVSRDYVRVVTKRLRDRGLIDIKDGKFVRGDATPRR